MDQTQVRKTRVRQNHPEVNYATYGVQEKDAKVNNNEQYEPLPIEDAPPVGRIDTVAMNILKGRILRTLELGVPVGKAFPVPAKSKATIHMWLNKTFPEQHYSVSHKKNDAFARIVRKA
jgi:hypothetical protein